MHWIVKLLPLDSLPPKNIHLDTKMKSIAALDPEIIPNEDLNGGHFEIQYGGHKERNPSGSISKNVRNMLMYMCAKFGACITKCTIGLLSCPTMSPYVGCIISLDAVMPVHWILPSSGAV